MRRVKQVSIAKYIVSGTAALIIVMTIVMLAFINLLANVAIEYDVKSNLISEARKNGRNLVYENGKVKATSAFLYEDEDVHFVVLDETGKILLGTYPNGMDVDFRPKNGEIHLIKSNGEAYYILDRTNIGMTKETGRNILIRSIVKKTDISSRYQTIKYLSYMLIPIMVLCVIINGLIMANRISVPIKQICQTAESIGRDEDLSSRMDYHGKFKEIEILSRVNNRMLERLESMFDSQKQFTSDVAHELRTPVAVIIAQCEYAREHLDNKEDFDEAIDVIHRQAHKTNNIIIQLLNLTRLEQNRMPLDLEYIDLKEIIQSVCEEEQRKSSKQIHFTLEISRSDVCVDISLITILIQNLINNAVKYSPDNAVIEVKTERKDNTVLLSVRDYGCGISGKDLKNIFSRFYRVEESRNSEGFGLGLPLAEKIAEIHGGKITVVSKVGEGSTFTLVLPEKNEKF